MVIKKYNMIGIYGIKNLITGKMYIGKSINCNNRERDHFYNLKANKHHSEYLQNSYNKHGKEVFVFGIIEKCKKEELDNKEKYWIDFYDSFNNGYNCTLPTGANVGHFWSDKEKIKLSISMKKAWNKPYRKKVGKQHMDYVRSFVNYNKIDYNHKNKRKYYLYNPDSIMLEHTFNYKSDCANFLSVKPKQLSRSLDRIWKEKGISYKGYYIIREGESLEEYLKLVNFRIERKRLRNLNKKEKYYTTISYEERCKSWKNNASKGSEIYKQQLRDEGTHKVKVFKDTIFIKEYLIPYDAAEDLNIPVKCIHKVLGGEQKSTRGYTFIREKEGVLM